MCGESMSGEETFVEKMEERKQEESENKMEEDAKEEDEEGAEETKEGEDKEEEEEGEEEEEEGEEEEEEGEGEEEEEEEEEEGGEEKEEEGEGEEEEEERIVKRRTCGGLSYREKLKLARLIKRKMRRKKESGWGRGQRTVVKYSLWRRANLDHVLAWVDDVRGGGGGGGGGRGGATHEVDWGRLEGGKEEEEGEQGEEDKSATSGEAQVKGQEGVASPCNHGNITMTTPLSRPKKRVSFGLHKNQIFTPQ